MQDIGQTSETARQLAENDMIMSSALFVLIIFVFGVLVWLLNVINKSHYKSRREFSGLIEDYNKQSQENTRAITRLEVVITSNFDEKKKLNDALLASNLQVSEMKSDLKRIDKSLTDIENHHKQYIALLYDR